MKEIIKVIKKYPNCFLYFTDNGEFTFYTSKKDFERLERLDKLEDDEYEKWHKKIALLYGSDYGADNVGYATALVLALAKCLNIEVDSI